MKLMRTTALILVILMLVLVVGCAQPPSGQEGVTPTTVATETTMPAELTEINEDIDTIATDLNDFESDEFDLGDELNLDELDLE